MRTFRPRHRKTKPLSKEKLEGVRLSMITFLRRRMGYTEAYLAPMPFDRLKQMCRRLEPWTVGNGPAVPLSRPKLGM